MPWTLSGEMIETCSCNMLCPCWYGVQELMVMDQGWCASPILFRLRDGTADGVTLSGLTLALALFFPGPTLYDGNATARLYLEETTTADQRSALEPIMQGQRGGPMQVLAGLITTWLPTQTAPIAVQETNGTIQATVGNVGEIQSQRLKNEAGQPMTMQNVGLAGVLQFDQQRAELAPSTGTLWSDPDLPRQWESKSGAVGTFTWSGR
ncbi:MAG TPA: DUF1326 domain-containing protein [Candidatus Tectomicrobia bacterium]|nr:DUF1326 domain-containing protein [Candidatus Tectomicrobia bacterium]